MPSVELVAIGTELLLGQLADTNTRAVAQAMAACGIDVHATHAVGDNRTRIAQCLRAALERAEGVITTGGLGPTVDDLTKEAVCDALGLATTLHEPSLAHIEAVFRSFGRTMTPNNRKQAELPAGAVVLENPNGTAPGFIAFAPSGRFVASLPGPPREMLPMLSQRLVPYLRTHWRLDQAIFTRVLHTVGIGESDLDARIDDLFRSSENPKIAVLAHDFRADIKLMAKAHGEDDAAALMAPLEAEIRRRLAGYVFGVDAATPASAALDALRTRGWRLALAESCTGGRIAAALTAVAGASSVVTGAIVAYDNAVKVRELGVDAEAIAREGAVSAAVASAMARGARERLATEVALASTGIAGPDGGSPAKPVGTVVFAIAGPDTERVWSVMFPGDRDAVQARATVHALAALWRFAEMKDA